MRLTLRTLLAYLDDAIEPSEAQDLAKKIEESEFAAGLVQRLRGVTKKPRLPAPKLDGKGLGNDANSVAEYIESTLPPEKIAEFERLCIESDMHLAEIAATHQILTLVLGRPSKVSQELRERIYDIPKEQPKPVPACEVRKRAPEVAAGATVAEPPTVSLKGPLDAAAEEESPKEVPEYLQAARSAERRWVYVAITAAVGFLLTAVVLRAMGPFDGTHPIARMFGSRPVAVVPVNPEPPAPKPPVEPAPEPEPEPMPDPEPSPGPPEPAPMPVEPAENTVPNPVNPAPVPNPNEVAVKPVEPAPMPTPPEPDPTKPIVPAPLPVPIPIRPEVAVDVGRFTSDEQVLARFDATSKLWTRVKSKSLLMSGEPLIALPVFRPQIVLPSGVQVTVLGETHFQMLPPGDMGAPRLQLNLGRVSVITDGVPGGKLGLSIGGAEYLITLNDADSLVAVDVRRFLAPGSDPQNDKAVLAIDIIAANGHVDVGVTGSDPVELKPNHVMTIIQGMTTEINGPFAVPAWIDVRSDRDIDRDAARSLEKELLGERTLPIALTECLQDRRVEVRSLAARCLAHLGEFSGIMDELADARQASFWAYDIDTLKLLLASSPDTAARVQQAVDRRFGGQAIIVYRMLGGFNNEQLKAGSGNDLIKALESPDLEMRVVAAYTLERVVGSNFNYRAAGRPETNRVSISRFKEKLANGELVFTVVPSARVEYKPLP